VQAGIGGDFTGLGTAHLIGKVFLGTVEALLVACLEPRPTPAKSSAAKLKPGINVAGDLSDALLVQGYAPSTATKYARIVTAFLQHVRPIRLVHLREDDVDDYLDHLKQRGMGNATLRLHLCAIRTVLDRLLGLDITVEIKHAPRPRPRPPATEDDMLKLLAACGNPKERFILNALNGSKALPSQLCRLGAIGHPSLFLWERHKDSIPDPPPCHVVPLVMDKTISPETGWLLPSSRRPGPISPRTMRRIVRRVAESCGVRTTCTAVRLGPTISFAKCA